MLKIQGNKIFKRRHRTAKNHRISILTFMKTEDKFFPIQTNILDRKVYKKLRKRTRRRGDESCSF